MKTLYNDMNIEFTIDHLHFTVLNVVYEIFSTNIPKHSHGEDSYEFHYIPYGKGRVTIADESYDVVPNTLYVTGPHIEHQQIPDKLDPMTEYCIYLKIRKLKTQGKFLNVFDETPIWFGQDTQGIHNLMKELLHELEQEYTGYLAISENLLSQFIIKTIRNYKHHEKSKKHFSTTSLNASKNVISEDAFLYDYNHITLEILASRLNLSTRQTERFIKQTYGKTFLQKKTEAKMATAALKLTNSATSITDLAYELGYSSVEHFSHAFKKYYGITATQYKNNYRK